MVDGAIRRFTRIDIKLLEKPAKTQACALVPNSDADGAVFIVYAHRDDCALEPGIRHARHRKQQFTRQESRLGHILKMVARMRCSKS
jgi:hypothetical protein